jgi:hypothetical protein
MELKHLVQRFVYRIESKPEGGFIARVADPTVPPLEAATREELQRKIQEKLFAALGEAFPNLRLPVEDKQLKLNVHIERQPGGGFTVHSEQTGKMGLEPATEANIDHQAEELLGFVDEHFPHLSQAIAARIASAALKLPTSQETTTALNGSVHFGVARAFPKTQSSSVGTQDLQLGAANLDQSTINHAMIANTPITPEASGAGKILRFILTVAIFGAIMYFFFYRR